MAGRRGTGRPGRGPAARLDDLVRGRSLRFTGPAAVLAARTPGEVTPVLAAAEQAARRGRWVVGYLGYEAAAGLPSALPVAPAGAAADGGLPLAWFAVFDRARAGPALPPPGGAPGFACAPWLLDDGPERHRAQVAAVRAAIAAGEAYQVNLTTRARSTVTGSLPALYAALAHAQRSALCCYLDTGRHVVASASPELFFRWAGPELTVRPMKGTAARGATPARDAAAAAALAASIKDRAENVMIVDLVRNDLGRFAVPGSVRPTALCALEAYPTVWQLASTVSCRPRPGTGLLEVLDALFPCGSVTGAPKRRSMALIAELEGTGRGVYCGAVGVLAPPGAPFRARFAVAIRTAVLDRETGAASYGTGGGITWGSEPAAEYAELIAKAAVLPGGAVAPGGQAGGDQAGGDPAGGGQAAAAAASIAPAMAARSSGPVTNGGIA